MSPQIRKNKLKSQKSAVVIATQLHKGLAVPFRSVRGGDRGRREGWIHRHSKLPGTTWRRFGVRVMLNLHK